MLTWRAAKSPIKISTGYKEFHCLGYVDGIQSVEQGAAVEGAVGEPAHITTISEQRLSCTVQLP